MSQGGSVSHGAGRARTSRADRAGADPVVARWIARTLAADPPRARSLVVTVWGDALEPHGGAVWLAALFRLLGPFGVNERLVRTSVFRLARDGWIDAQSRGRQSRYRLTTAGRARFEAAYRRIYAAPATQWPGEWQVVAALPGAGDASTRARLRDELRWEGFAALAPGCYLRPDLGEPLASSAATSCVLLQVRESGDTPALAAHVDALWRLDEVAEGYRRFLALFGRVIERFRMHDIARANPAQCFVVRTLLIHAFRRVLLRDPRLPAALLPLDWPGAAAYALTRDFYRLTLVHAEDYLRAAFEVSGEPLPPLQPRFHDRFGGLAVGMPATQHR